MEAMALSWARQENAPDGAVVVARNEVAGRLRGGLPWTKGGDGALLLAMVSRPNIDPLQEALLWLPASLAAADCLATVAHELPVCVWPDQVLGAATSVDPWCHTNVLVQLGPGRVDHAVFVLRADLSDARVESDPDELAATFVGRAQDAVRTLEADPQRLLDRYIDRCSLIGQRVRVELLPRGEARGRVVAIDVDGFLVLESTTGMLERVAPATLRSLEVVDP